MTKSVEHWLKFVAIWRVNDDFSKRVKNSKQTHKHMICSFSLSRYDQAGYKVLGPSERNMHCDAIVLGENDV